MSPTKEKPSLNKMNAPPQQLVLSSDEGGGSSDSRSDSSEDEVTEHPAPVMARAQVPIQVMTVHQIYCLNIYCKLDSGIILHRYKYAQMQVLRKLKVNYYIVY
nr:uncharacterized protein LOC116773691 [Danaus plexippus plexippus]